LKKERVESYFQKLKFWDRTIFLKIYKSKTLYPPYTKDTWLSRQPAQGIEAVSFFATGKKDTSG
jgi:hypothetical protein